MKNIVICPLCKGVIADSNYCRLKDGIPHHSQCLEYVENEKRDKEEDDKLTKKVNELLDYGIDKDFVKQLKQDYSEGLNYILHDLHTKCIVGKPWIVISENVEEELYGVNGFDKVENLKLAILEWYAEGYYVHSVYHDGVKKDVEVIQEVKIF